jgi:hypothetical protein
VVGECIVIEAQSCGKNKGKTETRTRRSTAMAGGGDQSTAAGAAGVGDKGKPESQGFNWAAFFRVCISSYYYLLHGD